MPHLRAESDLTAGVYSSRRSGSVRTQQQKLHSDVQEEVNKNRFHGSDSYLGEIFKKTLFLIALNYIVRKAAFISSERKQTWMTFL